MSNFVTTKKKACASLLLGLILIKLIISPWSTGVYIKSSFQSINLLVEACILIVSILGVTLAHSKFRYIYTLVFLSCISFVISTYVYTDNSIVDAVKNHFKIYLPLLCFPVLLSVYQRESGWFLNNVKRLNYFTIFLILVGFFLLPEEVNRLSIWWPAYFSGLHTSAYVALATMIIFCILYFKQSVSKENAIVIIIFCSISTTYFWGVRTATLASVVFIFGYLSSNYKIERLKLTSLGLLITTLILLLCVPFLLASQDFDTFTSGRISMYFEKYNQLKDNDLLNWLIGNGVYSDLIETEIWWWDKKGAHSDIITMLVEGGIIYLGSFVFILSRLFSSGSFIFKCVLCSALVTTLLSNGVFVRPTAGYLFTIAMVLSFDNDSMNS